VQITAWLTNDGPLNLTPQLGLVKWTLRRDVLRNKKTRNSTCQRVMLKLASEWVI
jgi:hypothetical protein